MPMTPAQSTWLQSLFGNHGGGGGPTIDIGADPGLQATVADVNASAPPLQPPNDPPIPRRQITYPEARKEGNVDAARVRKQQGMTDPEVQAGHTRAARHTPESGAPPEVVGDPDTFQHLPSRRNRGLDAEVMESDGTTTTNTRHRAQEKLIDDAVERSRQNGQLTPEGQAAAGDEVLWRTDGTGLDQREIDVKRNSGLFDEDAAIKASNARRAAAPPPEAPPATVETAPVEPPLGLMETPALETSALETGAQQAGTLEATAVRTASAATAGELEGASSSVATRAGTSLTAGAAAEAGIIGAVISAGVTTFQDADQVRDGTKKAGDATAEVVVSAGVGAAAGLAGMAAGAEIGAIAGSIVPGAGTVVGLVAGAIVGGAVGYVASELAERGGVTKMLGNALDNSVEAPLQDAWKEVAIGVDATKEAAAAVAGETKKAAAAVEDETKKAAAAVADTTKKAAAAVSDETKKAAAAVEDDAKKAAAVVADTTKKAAAAVEDETKKAAAAVADTTKKAAAAVEDQAKKAASAAASVASKAADAAGGAAKAVAGALSSIL